MNCTGLLIDNVIVPVIVFQIFNSIAELGAANLSNQFVLNWQAVTKNLGVGLLSDIFRISDFFWKLGVGLYSANYGNRWSVDTVCISYLVSVQLFI